MDPTIILGLDPGSRVTGYGVVGRQGNRVYCVDFGAVRLTRGLEAAQIADRLFSLYHELMAVLDRFRPHRVAVESIFHAANVKSALTLGHARGVALLAAAEAGVPVREYAPLEVKQAVTGYGRADKRQVREMVRRLLKLPEDPTPLDASDALAVALCEAFRGELAERLAGIEGGATGGSRTQRRTR
ncbi:MAG: crossover junction endodeoxyribonuclease RuvC [Acidobacteriota bacterium]